VAKRAASAGSWLAPPKQVGLAGGGLSSYR